ncbi:MAG TPA: NAD-dependent epimerase/dehydratase family protein [Ilumatobacter sp.]|nr:NAD-dependent epimerase/dehydratase family protein [Ilumatobacter sp.]
MTSTALVLGGSVFVGKHLVERLLAHDVHVAVLNRGRTPSELPRHVERIIADRTDANQMRGALDGRHWDAVYDVSGFVMAAGGSDIDGLLDLLDGRVGAYVYTSSILAYDQSWVGVFPWTEQQPTNRDGPASYGGFKAMAEQAILARHARTGFPGSVARPAAIYGPDNNIYDMELPMFLRLLHRRPILVPHGGLVVGSYGHVDDLCEAMITMACSPHAAGEVFNVSGESVDVNRYVAVLAGVAGAEPDVVHVPDDLLPELSAARTPPAFGHLFRARHHAMVSTIKLQARLGITPRFDLRSGHAHTYEWFCAQGFEQLAQPLVDPVWKATWDFEHEAVIAGRIRSGV